MRETDDFTNKVFLALNLISGLGYGVFRAMYGYQLLYFGEGGKEVLYGEISTGFFVSICFLEVVSGTFLGIAVFRLFRLAKAGEGDDSINVPQLILHFSVFASFIVSLLVQLGFYLPYIWNQTPKNSLNSTITQTVCNYIGMVSMLMMAAVMMPLTKA